MYISYPSTKSSRIGSCLALILALLSVPHTVYADSVQDILADYQNSKGGWFSVVQGEHTLRQRNNRASKKDNILRLPNYVWIANLTNSIDTDNYRICEACLLRKNWRERNYLTTSNHKHSIVHAIKSLDKYLKTEHWLYLKARADGFLHQTYHERGLLPALLTAVTWLPYTMITELVIEPLLIGPLHVICPLFQVLYFTAIDVTHSSYSNVLHSFSLHKNNDLSLPQRVLSIFTHYQQPKGGAWQLHGQDIKKVDSSVSTDYNDRLVYNLLRSELAERIVINILRPPPAKTVLSDSSDSSVAYAHLASDKRDEQLRFVNLITVVPTILVSMLALDFKLKLEQKEIAAQDYRSKLGAIGKIRKGITTTEMYLKKTTFVPKMVKNSHNDPVYVNVQRLTEITYSALEKLIDALVALHAPDGDYDAAVNSYTAQVGEFSKADLVYNVTAARRE